MPKELIDQVNYIIKDLNEVKEISNGVFSDLILRVENITRSVESGCHNQESIR